jgi:hypothetical protein
LKDLIFKVSGIFYFISKSKFYLTEGLATWRDATGLCRFGQISLLGR